LKPLLIKFMNVLVALCFNNIKQTGDEHLVMDDTIIIWGAGAVGGTIGGTIGAYL